MQLMIDLAATNDPAMLRRVAALLLASADGASVLVARPDIPAPAAVPSGTTANAAPAALIPPPPIDEYLDGILKRSPAEAFGLPTVAATAPAANTANTITPVIPPPPPPPAPVTTLTTASAGSTVPNAVDGVDVQLDKAGFPYDERIHSGTPTINKSDGLWRTKRGVERPLIEAVEAELREKGYGVTLGALFVPPPPVSLPGPVIPPPPAVVAAPNAPTATVIPPPPGALHTGVVAGVPPAPPAGEVDPFRALMKAVEGKTGPDGPLRREAMLPIYAECGVDGLPGFYHKRDKIPLALERIRALLAV